MSGTGKGCFRSSAARLDGFEDGFIYKRRTRGTNVAVGPAADASKSAKADLPQMNHE
jgi:hypothetical protein